MMRKLKTLLLAVAFGITLTLLGCSSTPQHESEPQTQSDDAAAPGSIKSQENDDMERLD